uniref:protein OS-9 isoform X2 n=1 Tax=Myxine glutinosa TaxID=7769 RepID=UPI00358E8731
MVEHAHWIHRGDGRARARPLDTPVHNRVEHFAPSRRFNQPLFIGAMAMSRSLLWVCALCWMCGARCLAFLNVEELMEAQYTLEISAEPVISGQAGDVNMLEVTSRFGQHYECLLPTQGVKLDISLAKDDKVDSHSGNVSELLQPMEAEACLTKKVNWWTYEFCYGKSIKQYHMEGTEIQGEILLLGLYQSDFIWGNSTLKESRKHRLQRYHSQRYVNGTPCDLNGMARETEVRFTCEDGVQDYLHSVSEPESCVYILWVRTARICQHPMLRPPRHPPSLTVTCHPALSLTQYEQHLLLRHREEEDVQLQSDGLRFVKSASVLSKFKRILQKMKKNGDGGSTTNVDETEDTSKQPHQSDSGASAEPTESSVTTKQEQPMDKGSKGKVRIRVFSKVLAGEAEEGDKDSEKEGDSDELGVENAVNEALDKSGVNMEGKVNVKVITRGTKVDDDVRWLSEEETKLLTNLLVEMLIGKSEEASKEEERQLQLEESYRFVWDHQEHNTQGVTTELDDMDL